MTDKIEVQVWYDSDPECPREWDNLGTFVAGAYGADVRVTDSRALHDHMRGIRPAVIMPVYRYAHGGVVYRTAPFHDPWDSGQVGVIYVTRERMVERFGANTPDNRKLAEEVLRGEIAEFSKWANGEVYGYTITRRTLCALCEASSTTPKKCPHCTLETVDSCGGINPGDADLADTLAEYAGEAAADDIRAEVETAIRSAVETGQIKAAY